MESGYIESKAIMDSRDVRGPSGFRKKIISSVIGCSLMLGSASCLAAEESFCANFIKKYKEDSKAENSNTDSSLATSNFYGGGIVCAYELLEAAESDDTAVLENIMWAIAFAMVEDTPWVGAIFRMMRSSGGRGGQSELSIAVDKILEAIAISEKNVLDGVQQLLLERDFASLDTFKRKVNSFHIDDLETRTKNIEWLRELWGTSLSLKDMFEINSNRLTAKQRIETFHAYLSIVSLELFLRAELVALEHPESSGEEPEMEVLLRSHYENELLSVFDYINNYDWEKALEEIYKVEEEFKPALMTQPLANYGYTMDQFYWNNTVIGGEQMPFLWYLYSEQSFDINGISYSIKSNCPVLTQLECSVDCTSPFQSMPSEFEVICSTELSGEGDWEKFGLDKSYEKTLVINKGELDLYYDLWGANHQEYDLLKKVEKYLIDNYEYFPSDIMDKVVNDTVYLDLLEVAYLPSVALHDQWWQMVYPGESRPLNDADRKMVSLRNDIDTSLKYSGL